MQTSVYRFTVVVEPCEEGGFFAFCPALPGCHAQGESYEQTIHELREIIKDFIEDYIADGEAIPEDEFTVTSLKVAV